METLSQKEIDGLYEALDDEYKSLATYDKVIEDFGPIRPFINIRESEARHIDALLAIFSAYDIEYPANNWVGNVPHYKDVESACAAAVEAEIANSELYDRIMDTTERSDILTVYRNLNDASQQRHLKAFRRCMERRGDSVSNKYRN